MSRRGFAKSGLVAVAGITLAGRLAPQAGAAPVAQAPIASVRARSAVLVHGLYADGSSWIDVVPHLQNAGLNVAVVQNPLTTLADAVAETRRVLALQPGPVVLGGHSWSGTLVSEVGNDPSVSALAYIAARAPDAGEDFRLWRSSSRRHPRQQASWWHLTVTPDSMSRRF